MGGIVPLGYDIVERKLIPNIEEAKTINYIFKSYLEIKSIDLLRQKLNLENIKTKQWQARSGKSYGRTKWTNSMLERVLRNPVYIGKIHHSGNIYEGEHDGIIEEGLFSQVQELLNNQNRRNNDKLEVGRYLLFQKLYDENNEMRMAILNLKEYQSSKTHAINEAFNHQLYISSNKQVINIIADTRTNKIIPTKVNKILLKALATGYRYKKAMENGISLSTLSKQENKQDTYIGRMTKLGYLSPRIIENIFEAKHNEKLTVSALESISAKSYNWQIQESEFQKYQ